MQKQYTLLELTQIDDKFDVNCLKNKFLDL